MKDSKEELLSFLYVKFCELCRKKNAESAWVLLTQVLLQLQVGMNQQNSELPLLEVLQVFLSESAERWLNSFCQAASALCPSKTLVLPNLRLC